MAMWRSPRCSTQWRLRAAIACAITTAWLNVPEGALAGPELVVLVRHGHKDQPQPGADLNNYNLSETGFLQSLQLSLLLPACLAEGRPLHLGAYGFNPSSGKNARSYQTLVPLAVSSGRNIELFVNAAEESTTIGQRLRDDSRLKGGLLVLAWEHHRLPDLARGLGWDAMPAVEEGDFDRLWLLRYGAAGEPPAVEVLSQQALSSQPCLSQVRDKYDRVLRAVNRWMQRLSLSPLRHRH